MARREKKGDDGGGYSYMDTYGDMVTLLLTFFVLLFAFSSVDDAKWNSLVEAFTGMPPRRQITAIELLDEPSFNSYIPLVVAQLQGKKKIDSYEIRTVDGQVEQVHQSDIEQRVILMDPATAELIGSPEYLELERQFRQLYEDLLNYVETEGLEDMLYVERDSDSIYLRVTSGVLFESGSDVLLPDYLPMLDRLENMLYNTISSMGSIQIEGHTDSVPIRTLRFKDNRALSSGRANSVVNYIESLGRIPRDMLVGIGYGEYHPIATNDTEEGKQLNRRVQFILAKRALTIEDIREDEIDDQQQGGGQSAPAEGGAEEGQNAQNEQGVEAQ